MDDEYVLKSSVLSSIHSGDIDMGMVTPHEYRLLKDLSERIDRRIQRVPVSDVSPVRHGRWIFGTTMHHDWMKCSECLVSQDLNGCFSYCPNCGAKMDKGGYTYEWDLHL